MDVNYWLIQVMDMIFLDHTSDSYIHGQRPHHHYMYQAHKGLVRCYGPLHFNGDSSDQLDKLDIEYHWSSQYHHCKIEEQN